RRFWSCDFFPLQLVDQTDDNKQNERDDEKVQCQRNELAVGKHGALLLCVFKVGRGDSLGQPNEVVREIEATRHRADQRHDDVRNQRTHDAAKRSADDHTNREINDVTLDGELTKFLQHVDFLAVGTVPQQLTVSSIS